MANSNVYSQSKSNKMADEVKEKKPRKPRTPKATNNQLLDFVNKLNSNQSEYVRFALKKQFGGEPAPELSDFERELFVGIKAAFTA